MIKMRHLNRVIITPSRARHTASTVTATNVFTMIRIPSIRQMIEIKSTRQDINVVTHNHPKAGVIVVETECLVQQGSTGNSNQAGFHGRENDNNQDSNSSDRWQLFSPLARQDESQRNRFDSFSSYNRPPNPYAEKRMQHHPGDKSFHGNKGHGDKCYHGDKGHDKSRFNSDHREVSHFHREQHSSYSGSFNRFEQRDRRDSHRGYNSRQDFRYFSHTDRKRKSNERDWLSAVNDPRRNFKEPKMYVSPVMDEAGPLGHIPAIVSPGPSQIADAAAQQRYMQH
ncbi:hypothetical protein LSH36_352g00011 [Paralvinella palmiformis]|uniref:Uncharacterized protein n=1 Tax=Paralvinella palmiformis TaxID=53620 RepID=A0AAD9N2F5_9ANNE|nr:hypothetical protein LSH36_352g00011 [Paralvinella palmiformis]